MKDSITGPGSLLILYLIYKDPVSRQNCCLRVHVGTMPHYWETEFLQPHLDMGYAAREVTQATCPLAWVWEPCVFPVFGLRMGTPTLCLT